MDNCFEDPLLSWFGSYLKNRKQYVKVFGYKSAICNIPSGVPQGGHISPLLFSLFINSIKSVIRNSKFLLFADDLKLFLKFSCESDCQLL
jgi:retron-type reverse transcriptase